MKLTEIELDDHLKDSLDCLRKVSPLGPQAVAEERIKFLTQGEEFRTAVSQPENRRHNGWINALVLSYYRKERIPMLNTLMAIVVTIALLFGGTGATVYAAQGSMPDELLYPIKTWSEDVRLSLAGSIQEKLDLTLEFTDRRVAEIISMHACAQPVLEEVTLRLQDELDGELQLAVGMDDPQMMQALEQIRLQAETQSQNIAAVMGESSTQGDRALVRIQDRLQEQVRLAATGEADPQSFRLMVRDRIRQHSPIQTSDSTPPGPNPHTPNATPFPTGNSYGPGPAGSQATRTPGYYGPGEPNPNQTPMPTGGSYGPGQDAGQRTSTPGGYGPGPQTGTSTCTPAQNGEGPGNGADPSQTPQSGGPGSGSQNPSATPLSGGPGPGEGQATATPQLGNNNGTRQPTMSPGHGRQP